MRETEHNRRTGVCVCARARANLCKRAPARPYMRRDARHGHITLVAWHSAQLLVSPKQPGAPNCVQYRPHCRRKCKGCASVSFEAKNADAMVPTMMIASPITRLHAKKGGALSLRTSNILRAQRTPTVPTIDL